MDPVRKHSLGKVTRRLDRERDERLAAAVRENDTTVAERLRRLDAQWDIERVLQTNAATLTLVAWAAVLRRPSRRRALAAGIVPAFLLQHALQGWCPPIELFRFLGRRSRNEIDAERTALKALRGDFADLPREGPPAVLAGAALAAAGRR